MKIYTNFGRQKTLREFLIKLFSSESSNYRLNVETYHDEECKSLQCQRNKYRSFDDILDCVNTYYKNITPKCLIHTLLTLNIKNDKGQICCLHIGICSGIKRIRMLYYPYPLENTYSSEIPCEKYNSKYSWIDLLEMLNITTSKELINYIKKYKKL